MSYLFDFPCTKVASETDQCVHRTHLHPEGQEALQTGRIPRLSSYGLEWMLPAQKYAICARRAGKTQPQRCPRKQTLLKAVLPQHMVAILNGWKKKKQKKQVKLPPNLLPQELQDKQPHTITTEVQKRLLKPASKQNRMWATTACHSVTAYSLLTHANEAAISILKQIPQMLAIFQNNCLSGHRFPPRFHRSWFHVQKSENFLIEYVIVLKLSTLCNRARNHSMYCKLINQSRNNPRTQTNQRPSQLRIWSGMKTFCYAIRGDYYAASEFKNSNRSWLCLGKKRKQETEVFLHLQLLGLPIQHR